VGPSTFGLLSLWIERLEADGPEREGAGQ
jgi:hypothetical protein